MKEDHINTSQQVIRIKSSRGILTIGPRFQIHGLWQIVRKELRTNQQVRELCGGIDRNTLLRWRKRGFPEPVLKLKVRGGTLELWSRTDVQRWMHTTINEGNRSSSEWV